MNTDQIDILMSDLRKVECVDQARTLIRLHLAGIPAAVLQRRMMSDDHGAFSALEIQTAVSELIVSGFARICTDGRYHQAIPDAPVSDEYLAKADAYRRARHPTALGSVRNALVWLFTGPLAGPTWLMVFLLLTTRGCMALAQGEEVPAWVLRGIAAQENGVHWNDVGDIDGAWVRGTTGAVGPWHISLAVLSDLGLSAHADRIHSDPVYAESITRLWLTHLYGVTGDWLQVCAAWRAGLRDRHRPWARDYAIRARNYGTTY